MFKIAVCDDEQALIDTLKTNLEQYARQTGIEFCFFAFHDGTELLENYQPDFDLSPASEARMRCAPGMRAFSCSSTSSIELVAGCSSNMEN